MRGGFFSSISRRGTCCDTTLLSAFGSADRCVGNTDAFGSGVALPGDCFLA
jgi:hypothetical protein